MLEHNISPSLEDLIGDVELPVDSKEKSDLVLVDLMSVEPRNLAPSPSRVVPVLEILGGQDQSREEHAAATLERAIGMSILGLLSSKVVSRDMRLDENQVVESNLKSGVAGARAAQSLLDKGAQRENRLATQLASANNRRERPNCFDNLSRRINKAIDEVHFSVGLSNQRRADLGTVGSSSRVLA